MQIEKPVKFILPAWHINQFKIQISDQVSIWILHYLVQEQITETKNEINFLLLNSLAH